MVARLGRVMVAVLLAGGVEAKPTKEQLKLVGKDKKVKQRFERLHKTYHCEACRVVLEELEYHLGELKTRAARKKDGLLQPLDPGDMLDKMCAFGKKQPKKYKNRWRGYPITYKRFCKELLRDNEKKMALIRVMSGDRTAEKRNRQAGMVRRVKELCADKLAFCPKKRYTEAQNECDACRKIMVDLDDMLSRSGARELDEGEIAEQIQYQCEALPWRFVGTMKPTNLMETTCQDVMETNDDDIIQAAMMQPEWKRRKALLSVCRPRCKKQALGLKLDYDLVAPNEAGSEGSDGDTVEMEPGEAEKEQKQEKPHTEAEVKSQGKTENKSKKAKKGKKAKKAKKAKEEGKAEL
jgi:hypothetical protein